MDIIGGIVGPIAGLIDKIIPDPKARDEAKLKLLELQGSQEMDLMKTQISAIVAEAQSTDPWTSRARPSFLYVMYTLLLWAIPMGLIGAVQIFAGPFVLTNGGPGDATRTVVMYIYEQGFRFFNMGYASTVALSLFVVLFGLTALQFVISRRWVFYQ